MSMTKKKGFLFLSFIPVALIVVIILVTGYLLLADDLKFPIFDNKPKIRRLEGFPQNVYTDKQLEKMRIVIKNDEELNNFLNQIDSTGLLTLKEKINYEKEYLVAVTSPNRNLENHSIKIKKLYEDENDKKLIVSVHEIFQAEECQVISDPHISVDLVAVNKLDYQFDFEKVTDTIPCKR